MQAAGMWWEKAGSGYVAELFTRKRRLRRASRITPLQAPLLGWNGLEQGLHFVTPLLVAYRIKRKCIGITCKEGWSIDGRHDVG
jgi:hypothetical protein